MRPFLRTIAIVFLVITCLLSCKGDDDLILPACGVDHPARELAWLKAEIDIREANPTEDMKYCYILQAEFEGDTIFVYWDCNPIIDKAIPVYNCEGTLINPDGGFPSFETLEQKTIVWRPDNLVCEISF